MKITDKKKPINTVPDGVWEADRPDSDKRDKNSELSATTDLQGNGYPTNQSGK
ncbi:MAG: hypothetical protein IJ833_00900 [Lachnospiraceae bacterium]|nr:hypothetical protein [Lachnospiraceae bacterium]